MEFGIMVMVSELDIQKHMLMQFMAGPTKGCGMEPKTLIVLETQDTDLFQKKGGGKKKGSGS